MTYCVSVGGGYRTKSARLRIIAVTPLSLFGQERTAREAVQLHDHREPTIGILTRRFRGIAGRFASIGRDTGHCNMRRQATGARPSPVRRCTVHTLNKHFLPRKHLSGRGCIRSRQVHDYHHEEH
jgi:hypothetical protein